MILVKSTYRSAFQISSAALVSLALTTMALGDRYVNGGIDPQPGGCNGLQYSLVETPSNLFGNNTRVEFFHQADDFTVPSGQNWTLSQLTWQLYQTNSSPEEPMQAVFVQVWSGNPMNGGQPIAGDMVTNRLLSTRFTDVYRVSQSDPGSCARAIKEVSVDMSWLQPLSEGEYWIEVGTQGHPGFSGPWANHVVPRDGNENSIYYDVSANLWVLNDSNGVGWDYPFEFEYTTDAQVSLVPYPLLQTSGSCPGPVTITVDHCTPRGTVALIYGYQTGPTFIPPQMPCGGTMLDIRNPVVAATVRADAQGRAVFRGSLPPSACTRLYLQALDLATCHPSGVTLVPFGDLGDGRRCEYRIKCRLAESRTTCAGPVLDVVAALEGRYFYSEKTCPQPVRCDTERKFGKITVRYKDANDIVRDCEVEVEYVGTGNCVNAVASPFRLIGQVPQRDCADWNP